MTSRKLLVAFDPQDQKKPSSDFLVPIVSSGTPFLFGLKSKAPVSFGMVVLVGKSITANDLFARLVDTGMEIPSVAGTMDSLSSYLAQVSKLRIGQVVAVSGPEMPGETLLVAADVPRTREQAKLPE